MSRWTSPPGRPWRTRRPAPTRWTLSSDMASACPRRRKSCKAAAGKASSRAIRGCSEAKCDSSRRRRWRSKRGRRWRAKRGWPVHILGDSIEGEARDVGKVLAGLALQVARHGQPFAAAVHPVVRRRNDSDRARAGARRAQCRVSCCRSRSRCRVTRRSCARRRHRRCRRREEIAGAYIGPDTLDRAWARA